LQTVDTLELIVPTSVEIHDYWVINHEAPDLTISIDDLVNYYPSDFGLDALIILRDENIVEQIIIQYRPG